MSARSFGRWFFAIVFVLAPLLFIAATAYRLFVPGDSTRFSGVGFDRPGIWVLLSLLCLAWLTRAFAIMTSTSSDSDAERAASWYFNQWHERYAHRVALYERWISSKSRDDYDKLTQYEDYLEKWSNDMHSKLVNLEMGSAGHLLHYTWGNKENWEYLDENIKDYMGIE